MHKPLLLFAVISGISNPKVNNEDAKVLVRYLR